jgi:hypothetical protein
MRLELDKNWELESAHWLTDFSENIPSDFEWMFPQHLPVEQIAAYHGDHLLRMEAARLLADRPWASAYDNPRSILWVLRFRVLAAIAIARGNLDCSTLHQRALSAPESRLRRIAERMTDSDLLSVMVRCPY